MNEAYVQNLIDAGMDKPDAEICVRLLNDGKLDDLERRVACHRAFLLDSLHKNQNEIDRLDYFLYSLKNKQ